jgi:magnesium chelatase family protein
MSSANISTIALTGLNSTDVDVQAHISNGMFAFNIVGLGDKAISESKERVRSALSSVGLSLPSKRILINLAPANLVKEGTHFDLPIALAILVAMNVVQAQEVENYIIMGELSLDSSVSPVSGVLPAAMHALGSGKGIICPAHNGSEAAWAGEELPIIAAKNLVELINHLKNISHIERPKIKPSIANNNQQLDISDIKGQENAKRALEIAASGKHNILMSGPPGSGKSMLAARINSIMPDLTANEILENSIIASVVGDLQNGELSTQRPFRSPHHSCSMASLTGGGRKAKPGEITLAHNGILFLDELPEYSRQSLEALRQPLENHNITVARADNHITYPANFQLIAAMNPCKCGYLSIPEKACNRVPDCAKQYQSKISGPLLDRIDIVIDVPQISPFDVHEYKSETSAQIKERVQKTRLIQQTRYKNDNINSNGEAGNHLLEKYSALDEESKNLLKRAMDKFKLSMRGYTKILKVARTIADMEGSQNVEKRHLAEAISYRQVI